MFKKNESYKQGNLFGIEQSLTKKQLKIWESSNEHCFFETVFQKIDEDKFRVLYSEEMSRPNVPVNQLVGSLILKHLNDWTYAELFKQMSFNMLSRHAIGINDWNEDIYAPASLYNFQNKVIAYYLSTGIDLFEEIFNSITSGQLKKYKVESDIQRGDSFLMGSKIIDHTRLSLILEVLNRLVRELKQSDQKRFEDKLLKYTKQKASKYVYKLDKSSYPKELAELGILYHQLYKDLEEEYKEEEAFKIFERVYFEHFVVIKNKVKVIESKAIKGGSLISPDDVDATYRKKGKVSSKGFVGHLSETANPENELNLIVDVVVKPNNVDDAKILEERLPEMIKKTPGLNEYHNDGLYGNENVDKIMDEHGIKQVQATMRGRKSTAGLRINQEENGDVIVKCNGGQEVEAEKKFKSWRVEFDYKICQTCPFKDECNTKLTRLKKKNPARYMTFADKSILAHKRFNNIETLPESRRTIRANVEATIKEAKRGMKDNKVRVRGLIKAQYYLIWTALAINLTRITRYRTQKTKKLHYMLKDVLSAFRKQVSPEILKALNVDFKNRPLRCLAGF